MLIAIVSLLVALGLRKAGVNIPYFDNIIYAAKMKVAEMKSNRLQKTFDKTLTTLDKPIYKENRVSKPLRQMNYPSRIFRGKLKI